MEKLPKNGSMTLDEFICTKTALGRNFQLTSLKLLFLTLGQFSFVLIMENKIFPIFGRLIFCIWHDHKTTWRYGWIFSSSRNMTILHHEFYHQNNPSLRAFQMPFQFPESNITNFLVFSRCKIIFFLLLADLYLCHKILHGIMATMVRCTHQ